MTFRAKSSAPALPPPVVLFAWFLLVTAAAVSGQGAAQAQASTQKNGASGDSKPGLTIEPVELPSTYLQGAYQVRVYGTGNYVPTLRWKVVSGKLPPGIRFTPDGLLQGAAQQTGEFNFKIAVTDGNQPPQSVQREFVIKVASALAVAWKVPPHVSGNRIEGSIEISNATADDVDLTYDVKAIAENGRATEIGYQHFPLRRGTTGMTLPFGETLPYGGYQVNVSVEGEVASRHTIYREQLQAPAPLHVVVGP